MKQFILIFQALLISTFGFSQDKTVEMEKDIFEVRIYNITSAENATMVDAFNRDVLLPAMKKQGVAVGAWKNIDPADNNRYIVLIYNNINHYYNSGNTLREDDTFKAAEEKMTKEWAANPPYTRFDSYLCQGFDSFPSVAMPDDKKGLYEMRIYQSPTEEALRRKMHMFGNGEIDIFKAKGVNCLFFGEVISGPERPVLIYMTWYDDMEQRKANWGAFGKSDEWAAMKRSAYYDNSTSKTKNIFLSALPHSMF